MKTLEPTILRQEPTSLGSREASAPRAGVRPRLRPSGGLVFSLDGSQRCPLCHDALRSGEALIACGDCGALYHHECHGGRCATLGCPGRSASEPSPPAAPRGRPSAGLRPLGGRTLAFLAILSLGTSLGSLGIQLASAPRSLVQPAVELVPLQPRPEPKRRLPPVSAWIELAPEPDWTPAGDYRLRGELRGEGEVEVRVRLNGQPVVSYTALAPAPLDLLLPLCSGANAVEVIAAPLGGGRAAQLTKTLFGH